LPEMALVTGLPASDLALTTDREPSGQSPANAPCVRWRGPLAAVTTCGPCRPRAGAWMPMAHTEPSLYLSEPLDVCRPQSVHVTSRGHMRFMIKEKGGVNAAVFIEFLKRLMVGSRNKIFVIVDRGPAHIAKKTKAFVASRRQAAAVLSSTLFAGQKP
jgi:hypothetical protein